MSVQTEIEDAIFDWADLVLNPQTPGYQTLTNTGSLGAFIGITVPGLASNTYDIDVKPDGGTLRKLHLDILITDSWSVIISKIQAALLTATGGNESVFFYGGLIKFMSGTAGAASSMLVAAGTFGSAGGDLLAAINALGATYIATLNTPVAGTVPANPIPIVWGDENGIIPDKAYVTMKTIAFPQLGQAWESDIKIPPTPALPAAKPPDYQEMRIEKELTLSVQGFGYNSKDYLDTLQDSLNLPTIQEYLDSKFLAVRDFGTVTNIAAVLDGTNEKRWLLEVVFGVGLLLKDDGGGKGRNWIETVQWAGSYNPPA